MKNLHPIHYALVLALITLLGGLLLAYQLKEPLIFVIGVGATYLLGAQSVGRFSADDDDDAPGDDYQGTRAGFNGDL